ncbi:type II toxin-antitoxin system CcdA family antitoxin [Roseibium alexandrii]|uniref:Post-segregation antitoxin (Ccd killing mechanism protein) encoded by the F plasmid n=1 Tax=Roseibium alexandrii TaxID=388408 RepID=A0A0M7AM07_9HYPH|nr:type II toxin-antitoxin system CcdA family antitoxin [Roseibium alexandrii]CTQ75472.1 Post-segregation antitoxin (ccd killing mechanism protein) encoded by the F plasmid [Roseibium alexandrii]
MASHPARNPTDLTIDPVLVQSAKQLGINISQAAEKGIRSAVSRSMADQWRQENQSALKSSNKFVEEHGLPLAKSQLF